MAGKKINRSMANASIYLEEPVLVRIEKDDIVYMVELDAGTEIVKLKKGTEGNLVEEIKKAPWPLSVKIN